MHGGKRRDSHSAMRKRFRPSMRFHGYLRGLFRFFVSWMRRCSGTGHWELSQPADPSSVRILTLAGRNLWQPDAPGEVSITRQTQADACRQRPMISQDHQHQFETIDGVKMTTEESNQKYSTLESVCDDFQKRLRPGENVLANDYVRLHPEIADDIAGILETLRAIEGTVQSAAETPAFINGCQVVRKIGSGGMGTVYEAVHPRLSRRLAIKVLNQHHDTGPELPRRFLREAEAASQLAHPNIVGLLEMGDDNGTLFLAMPYIDGISLDRLIRPANTDTRRQLPTALYSSALRGTADAAGESIYVQVARLGAAVASALQPSHAREIIHRDIKPANLIFDRDC
jgi:hypothetical protein